MNNNFVVSIPKELKTIKSKLFFGLTKRQLIGFSIALNRFSFSNLAFFIHHIPFCCNFNVSF
ncbi:PrgI family protein [Bacillus sp. D-CC]